MLLALFGDLEMTTGALVPSLWQTYIRVALMAVDVRAIAFTWISIMLLLTSPFLESSFLNTHQGTFLVGYCS